MNVAHERHSPKPESRYLENITFLLVDPNAFMRSTIRNLLVVFGCRKVVEVGDGAEALNALKSFHPDIVLTEWDMDPVDGVELTRMLRDDVKSFNPYIPIILMTAHSEYGRVITARDSGITEFVVKPLSAKSLVRHIVETIQNPRGFVATETYFGPDRRRRTRDFQGENRRGQPGAKRQPGKPIDRNQSLDQEQIDEVVAGGRISDDNDGGGNGDKAERKGADG